MLTNYSNKSKLPKSTFTKDEREALHSLKKDNNYMVLTADNGAAVVVIDKDTHIKMYDLLIDHNVYQEYRDLTKPIHKKVNKQLTDLQNSLGQEFKNLYPKLCPPWDNSLPARFYGLLKNP